MEDTLTASAYTAPHDLIKRVLLGVVFCMAILLIPHNEVFNAPKTQYFIAFGRLVLGGFAILLSFEFYARGAAAKVLFAAAAPQVISAAAWVSQLFAGSTGQLQLKIEGGSAVRSVGFAGRIGWEGPLGWLTYFERGTWLLGAGLGVVGLVQLHRSASKDAAATEEAPGEEDEAATTRGQRQLILITTLLITLGIILPLVAWLFADIIATVFPDAHVIELRD